VPVPRTPSKTFRREKVSWEEKLRSTASAFPSARELARVPDCRPDTGHIVDDDIPLQHKVVKCVPKEYTTVQEDLRSGEGSGDSTSTSKIPSCVAPYNKRRTWCERIAGDASSKLLIPEEPCLSHLYEGSSKGKGSFKVQGSYNGKKSSEDTGKAGLQEEPNCGRSLRVPWDARLVSIGDMSTLWDLKLPDNVPDPIAKAIAICLAPDGPPHGGVQEGPSGHAAGGSLSGSMKILWV
jgi:hypothetical protein